MTASLEQLATLEMPKEIDITAPAIENIASSAEKAAKKVEELNTSLEETVKTIDDGRIVSEDFFKNIQEGARNFGIMAGGGLLGLSALGVGAIALTGSLDTLQDAFQSTADFVSKIDFQSVASGIASAVVGVQDFIRAHPTLTKAIGAITTGLVALRVTGLTPVLGFLKDVTFFALRTAIPTFVRIGWAAGKQAAVGLATLATQAVSGAGSALTALSGTSLRAVASLVGRGGLVAAVGALTFAVTKAVVEWSGLDEKIGDVLFSFGQTLGLVEDAAEKTAEIQRKSIEGSLRRLEHSTGMMADQLAHSLRNRLEEGAVPKDLEEKVRNAIEGLGENVAVDEDKLLRTKEVQATLTDLTASFADAGKEIVENRDLLLTGLAFKGVSAGLETLSVTAKGFISTFELGEPVKQADRLRVSLELLTGVSRDEAAFSIIRLGDASKGTADGLMAMSSAAGLSASDMTELTTTAFNAGVSVEALTDTSTGLFQRMADLRGIFGLTSEQAATLMTAFDDAGEGGSAALDQLVGSAFQLQREFRIPDALPKIIQTSQDVRKSLILLGQTTRAQSLSLATDLTRVAGEISNVLDITPEAAQQAAATTAEQFLGIRRSIEDLMLGLETDLPGSTREAIEAFRQLGLGTEEAFSLLRSGEPTEILRRIAQGFQEGAAAGGDMAFFAERSLRQFERAGIVAVEAGQAIREGADFSKVKAAQDEKGVAPQEEARDILASQLDTQQKITEETLNSRLAAFEYRTQAEGARDAFERITGFIEHQNRLLNASAKTLGVLGRDLLGVQMIADPATRIAAPTARSAAEGRIGGIRQLFTPEQDVATAITELESIQPTYTTALRDPAALDVPRDTVVSTNTKEFEELIAQQREMLALLGGIGETLSKPKTVKMTGVDTAIEKVELGRRNRAATGGR